MMAFFFVENISFFASTPSRRIVGARNIAESTQVLLNIAWYCKNNEL